MKPVHHNFYTQRTLIAFLLLLVSFTINAGQKDPKEYYRLNIYHFKSSDQEKALDTYFQDALIPALHRTGMMRCGVFKVLANDTTADKMIYVIIPFSSLDQVGSIDKKLEKDRIYLQSSASFNDVPYTGPNYTRMETIILKIFPLADPITAPALKSAKGDRIYELRSYESVSEKLFANKVKMFNEGGEIKLFKRLNFNAVFYSSVVAGNKMPNLMYMTSFENMADRDAHWKSFSDDAEWKHISGLPEYQHNVSHIDIVFLKGTPYSDL